MADTNQKSVEQQASDVVEMAKKGQKIEQPLSTEVELAARKIIEGLDADNKVKVRAALDALKENVPDSTKLLALKKTMEQEVTSITTVEQAKKLLDKLDGLDADSRKIVISYLWSKLSISGYLLTIQNNKIRLNHQTDIAGATALEATLAAYVDAKKVNISEIQRAVIVGSGSFGSFLDTQSVNLKSVSVEKYVEFMTKTYQLDLSKGDIPKKAQLINASSATMEEKAFLISYVNGGFSNYNLVPDAERQSKLRKESQELVASPGFVQVQAAVNTASGGSAAQEQVKMQQASVASGKPQELTMESFMNNPASAISKYPWTSLALVIGGIWKFGFMKTIGGLLFGAIGIKAVNEIGGDTEIGKQIKKMGSEMIDTASTAATAAAGATTAAVADAVDTATETSQLSEFQRAGVNSIKNNKSLLEDISNYPKQAGKDKQNADLNTYIDLLHKDSIQNITLDKLIYTTDHDQSIFSDTVKSQFGDNKDIPDTVSRYLLKKTIRSYIGINAVLSLPSTDQKEGQQSLEDFKKKFPEDQWKTKTLKDLVNEVYKK